MVLLPSGDSCTASATHRIVWPDGDKTPACAECVIRARQLAETHKSTVVVEPLLVAI